MIQSVLNLDFSTLTIVNCALFNILPSYIYYYYCNSSSSRRKIYIICLNEWVTKSFYNFLYRIITNIYIALLMYWNEINESGVTEQTTVGNSWHIARNKVQPCQMVLPTTMFRTNTDFNYCLRRTGSISNKIWIPQFPTDNDRVRLTDFCINFISLWNTIQQLFITFVQLHGSVLSAIKTENASSYWDAFETTKMQSILCNFIFWNFRSIFLNDMLNSEHYPTLLWDLSIPNLQRMGVNTKAQDNQK
jgi:hypothetical protein